MESNIKGLVAAGHEMASELKAECGAVDMRSVAKLISDLATQLEVQLVRANALAAENVALRSKAAELAHEASKIYSAYNATITEPDGDFMDMQTLHEMQCIETPATDAFLAEVRAQAFNDLCSAFVKDATVVGLDDVDIVTVKEATYALMHCADQLRKGVHS
ncbi:TPA: hypothetical protein LZQ92_003090 [Escherichia coli]|nr:hypothetical protein [Escherichia coli]